MNYSDAVGYFDAHVGSGVRPGLERIEALVDLMAEPHTAYPVIHVAGTNGKTSTTLLAAGLVAAHGLKVGAFVSPHLEKIEERFLIDGEPITEERFAEALADVVPFVDVLEERTGERPTYFELTVALALALFAAEAVDIAVVEVGMGGRWDATNVVPAGTAVVTGIGLDHTATLGSTVAEIAQEKLAIVKPGATLVVGPWPKEASGAPEAKVEEVGARLLGFGRDFTVDHAVPAVGGWSMDVHSVFGDYEEVFLRLHGVHQTENFAVAVAAVEATFDRQLSQEAVRHTAENARVPGRIEVLDRNPLTVIDGAHNPGGISALVESLATEFPGMRWHAVFGALRDKDVAAMLATLRNLVDDLTVVPVPSPRTIPVHELAELARQAGFAVTEAESVASAVADARGRAGADGSVVVAGSLYLAGAARSTLV